MDPSGPSIPVQLGFLIVLMLISAFFAAAEAAFISVNKNRLRALASDGNKKAHLTLSL